VVLIRLLPGRQLRWSPAWGCSTHQIAFDATSGDYWVLTADARALLEWLAPAAQPAAAVWQHLRHAAEDGVILLQGLAQAGLVTGWHGGRPVPLPDEADTAV
jgi:hypothetical protein